jgi:hypothetical protein
MIRFLFFLFFLFPVSCSLAQSSPVPLIQLSTGHIAVTVRVNGEGPFRLIFDTGSPVTFITSRAAKAVKLPTNEGFGMMGMGGMATVKTFAVGGALVKDFGIMIMDHPVITMLSEFEGKAGKLDGIVGMSFFARFRTEIDYAGKKITLTPSNYKPRDVLSSIYGRLLGQQSNKIVVAPQGLWGFQAKKEGTDAGVVITQVWSGSAADAAGLKVGDRLLTIEHRWTDTLGDIHDAASRLPAGKDAILEILRDGEKQTLTLRPRLGL